jgi:hypothetical protein
MTMTLGGDPTVFPNGIDAGSLAVVDQLVVDGVDITDAVGAFAGTNASAAELNKTDGLPANAYIEVVETRTFTETTGAGTYTGTVALPPGAFLVDVAWHNTALWTATTSATMKVGTGADDDMFFTAVDLKAAPAADVNGAGGISSAKNDTGSGAAGGKTGYFAGATNVIGVVTTVGGAGNAGRSVMVVRYAVPTAVAATKA